MLGSGCDLARRASGRRVQPLASSQSPWPTAHVIIFDPQQHALNFSADINRYSFLAVPEKRTLCAWPRQKNLLCNDASLHHDYWHGSRSGDDGHRVLLHHHRHHRPWRHRPGCHPGKTLCCSQQKDTPGMSAKKGFTFVSRTDLYLQWVWWISLPYKQRPLALELLDGSP